MRSRGSRGWMSTRRRRPQRRRSPTGAFHLWPSLRCCHMAMPAFLSASSLSALGALGLLHTQTLHMCVACRAYEAVKAHQTAEAARRAEEERLTNLLYAEEVEVRAVSSAYCSCRLRCTY